MSWLLDTCVISELTLRLQAWRSEYGGEVEWGESLGQRILDAGADKLWPTLTETA